LGQRGRATFRPRARCTRRSQCAALQLGQKRRKWFGQRNGQLQKNAFTGVFSQFSQLNYQQPQPEHTQVGVIFKPAGAYPFIKKPLVDFRDVAVETTDFNAADFDDLHEQLGTAPTPARRIELLEKHLLGVLHRNFEETLMPAIMQLIQVNPQWSVADIAHKTGYTQQHLNRLLGKYAGINAKGLQKIFRVNAAMRLIRQMDDSTHLTDVAYQCQYFDQAHFIHDFKTMTGFTPAAYRALEQPTTSRIIYL
jgi:AraC-like DNA-binding protein